MYMTNFVKSTYLLCAKSHTANVYQKAYKWWPLCDVLDIINVDTKYWAPGRTLFKIFHIMNICCAVFYFIRDDYFTFKLQLPWSKNNFDSVTCSRYNFECIVTMTIIAKKYKYTIWKIRGTLVLAAGEQFCRNRILYKSIIKIFYTLQV